VNDICKIHEPLSVFLKRMFVLGLEVWFNGTVCTSHADFLFFSDKVPRVAQAGLKLTILLSTPPKCGDCSCTPLTWV
jgi:hypothetical protein